MESSWLAKMVCAIFGHHYYLSTRSVTGYRCRFCEKEGRP